jgi:cbb3-type cytochrome oxidase maturation protein
MSVIIFLLIASLSVALLFLGAFIWSVRNRQFEDDYAPPLRILFDDAPLSDSLLGLPSTDSAGSGAAQKQTSSSNIDPNPTNQ